jgi:hypothetical protein
MSKNTTLGTSTIYMVCPVTILMEYWFLNLGWLYGK